VAASTLQAFTPLLTPVAGVPKWRKAKGGLWILWKTAKVTNSPKAGLLITLSAAVYPQTPQPPRLITAIDNSKFSPTATPAVSVSPVWGIRRGFLLKTAEQAKISTVAAPVVETVGSLRCVSCFFLNCGKRAHLHIAPQCRTEKPYTTCGIAGLLEAQKRRNP